MKFSWRGGKKADSTAPAPVAGATPDADLTSIAPSRHSDTGSGAALVSNEKAGPSLTKKQKAMRHCARFKWWYLIAGILLLAIILPITFEVIIPAIVQAVVSHQGLPVHSGFFKVASPDVLIVSLNTTLNTPLPIHLDPLTMSLSRNAEEQDTPFTKFTIPRLRVKGLTETVFKNQTCPVTSPVQLGVWVADLFDKPNVSIHVKGNPSVYLGILHSNNHLSKTLTIPALNGFAGKTLDKLEINLERDSEGNNIAGAINLPNAGVLGLELGNLTLNLFSGDLKIGNVTLVNVTLNQGPNPIPFKGVLDLRAIIQNLGTVLTSQSQALGRGDIDLNSTISSVVVDGQHIPYLEQVLSTRTLTFSINVVTLIADVLASLLHSDRKNLGDLVDEIVGNKTLINEINSHWNSSEAKLIGSNHASNPFEGFKAMRRVSRDNLAWEMLKLSMKMKRNRV